MSGQPNANPSPLVDLPAPQTAVAQSTAQPANKILGYPAVYVYCAIILIVLILAYFMYKSEAFTTYFDQVGAQYSDPTWFLYNGDRKDMAGYSPRDYYLENQIYSENGVEARKKGDDKFTDPSDYSRIRKQYVLEAKDSALVKGKSESSMTQELLKNGRY